MRGLKEGLLSGAAGFVGFLLALLASAIWGGTIGLILFATDSVRSTKPQTWIDVAMGWAIFSAVITFIFETPVVRWIYRFMDSLQESFGAVTLVVIFPVHLTLLLGRIFLSFVPVKILSMVLNRYAEKIESICQYAGVVTASQQVRLQDLLAQPGDEVMRINRDWKIYRHDACFGWIDRSGRIYKDATVQYHVIDPDLETNAHPSGFVNDNNVYIANILVGAIVPE